MLHAVLDTAISMGDAYNRSSASARVVAACLDSRVKMIVCPALRDEYGRILPRAIRAPEWCARFDALMARSVMVQPAEVPAVIRGDPSGDMLFAAAMVGGAEAIVTNDRQLLRLGRSRSVRVVPPRRSAEELG